MKGRLAAGRLYLALMLAIGTASGRPRATRAETLSNEVRILMIASEAEADASKAAIRAIRAQLSDLSIDFQVAWTADYSTDLRVQAGLSERLAEEHHATIVFWSDLLTGDQVFLYVSEPGGGRILVRSIPFENEDQGDRFEVVAVIVRSVVEAIAGGGQIGIAPPVAVDAPGTSAPLEQPDDLPRPVPGNATQNAAGSARLDLAAAYGLTLYAPTKRFIHGARLGLAVRITRRGRLFMAYRIQAPFEAKNALVSLTLRPHPFEIGFSVRFTLGTLFLDLGASVVNDPLTWRITSADSHRVAPAGDRFRWLVGAAPFVRLSGSPSHAYKFYLAVSTDLYFNESRSFVARLDGDRTTVVDPFKVRPQLQLGVLFFLF